MQHLRNRTQKPAERTSGWEELFDLQFESTNFVTHPHNRKARINRRLKMLSEDFGDVILWKLQRTYYDPQVKARLKRHMGEVINLAIDITRALANVYDLPPRRRIVKGTEDQNKALIEINEMTRWGSVAPMVNRHAWFAGPVLEIPFASNGVLRRDIIMGDVFDVQTSDDDPLGHPISAGYTWCEDNRWVVKIVDQEFIRTFDAMNKRPIGSPVRHGVTEADGKTPRFPGTLWRFDVPIDIGDYWTVNRNKRLEEATIEAGTVYTTMSWVRKSQNRHIMAVIGNLQGLEKGAVNDAEKPVKWMVDVRDAPGDLSVTSFITPVAEFVNNILFIARTMIESYGIPQSAITFDFNSGGAGASGVPATALNLQHEKLTALRNEQIPFALQGEVRSQYNLLAVARKAGIAVARRLPSLKEFSDRLLVEFPPLTRAEDPQTTQSELDWQLGRGFTTDAEIYQMRHPQFTLEEAQQKVIANLTLQGELNDLKAKRELDPASKLQDRNQETGGTRGDPQPDTDDTPEEN